MPGARSFPELNLRTYVRDHRTGTPGVYFFSLDASNLLAVMVARSFYHLPYYWAEMRIESQSEREFGFYSRRRLTSKPVIFKARYRGLGPTRKLTEMRSGTLEYFLTERYCLFSQNSANELVRANVHHVPWPLEDAAADIEQNDWPPRLASSCSTRRRCCIIPAAWPSTFGRGTGRPRAPPPARSAQVMPSA